MASLYPPQSFQSNQQSLFPPQGNLPSEIPIDDPLLAIYPPLADNTFQFYKFYQIKKNQVPTTQANMPLVIIDSLGAGILQEVSGFDIRVFDGAGVSLPYEVQSVNITTGDIIVWVNMATVKDLEFIQMTFGKPTAIDGSTPNTVYDSNYVSTYHLNGTGIDSTSNAEDMTKFGTTTVAGKIGNAIDFAGNVNDYLIKNPYTAFPTSAITVEFWIKTTDEQYGTVSYATAGGLFGDFFIFQSTSTTLIVSLFDVTFGVTIPAINDNNFHNFVLTWKSTDGSTKIYLDGVLTDSSINSIGELFVNGGALVLAQEQDSVGGGFNNAQALNGILDEVKISDIVRDADYITATFNNQNNNNTFWFETPILENGIDNFLVDDQGRNIVAVQS